MPFLKKEAVITFLCKCGVEDSKTFVRIKTSGVLCKKCTMESRNKKAETTNLEKYGNTCTLQSDIVKAKAMETCLKHYGTTNVFKSAEILDKIKKTNQMKYGSENPFGSSEIKKKLRKTC